MSHFWQFELRLPINLDKSLDQLLIEGIQSFTQSYDELILNIESKIKSLSH